LHISKNPGRSSVILRLRAATSDVHRRIEADLDVIRRLSDATLRPALIRQFASLHISADTTLRPHLTDVPDLEFDGRSRARFFVKYREEFAFPSFPLPASCAEALGMLYVLEGSTLGGRMILRTLAARGVADPDLGFLDPYGTQTGARWHSFLSVLSRETDDDEQRIEEACRGGRAGFRHAARLLCQGAS